MLIANCYAQNGCAFKAQIQTNPKELLFEKVGYFLWFKKVKAKKNIALVLFSPCFDLVHCKSYLAFYKARFDYYFSARRSMLVDQK